MRFAYCINDDPAHPNTALGFIGADTINAAAKQLGHRAVNVYPAPAVPCPRVNVARKCPQL
ncbi:hypothetical protein SAMN04488020_104313 [Palleronia marisminoris]|uniref:Uncharacterized protein n=1 Tax=Palleronia marisminoris TaxID=315423 RepID=A0A1Y5SPU2_9RHOB|nr:hypothetical protein SAMN04488020_104313 [Palleronia marisminoris]SLN43878.1 hypothetical protein PAM7066_01936 [Palleronia marisminoris]